MLHKEIDRSMPTKQWILAERTTADLLNHLLELRKIDDVEAFLRPDFRTQLHDPFLMKDMDKAISRLMRAINSEEVVGVFADYDTDGTPGAALLLDGFQQLGVSTAVYVPTRGEGYGLSELGLRRLAAAGAKVIITIDLGITAKAEADLARELELDLIITDHHTVQADLFPKNAFAVINPKQDDCPYPFKDLCGGGIAWKLLSALLARLELTSPQRLRGRNPEAIRRWALDLAAISTVCDMVPLLGENRLLAHYGLQVLRKTRRPGLQALFEVAGINPVQMSAGTIGFQIGPRINAPTRLAAESYQTPTGPGPQASLALGLLLTNSQKEAKELAHQLQDYNVARQEQLEQILKEAETRVIDEGLMMKKIILLAQEGWPVGIVGLVAGRLMERFGRPAIVLGITGQEATGSARSVDGFPLVEALAVARKYLKRFGGHTKAAGLTVEVEHVQTLYDQLLAYAETKLDAHKLGPRLYIDAFLESNDISLETVSGLEQLGPHGIGNPRPLFAVRDLEILEVRSLGQAGQHRKLRFRKKDGDLDLNAIAFSWRGNPQMLVIGNRLDVAGYLAKNTWNGQTSLQLEVVDVRLAR